MLERIPSKVMIAIDSAWLATGCSSTSNSNNDVYSQLLRCEANLGKTLNDAERLELAPRSRAEELHPSMLSAVVGVGRALGKPEAQIAADIQRTWDSDTSQVEPTSCGELIMIDAGLLRH